MDQSLTEEERQARLAVAETAYEAEIEANLKRNYAANLAHGLLGQTGFRLVNAPTFVPAYIFLLSGSEFAVGLALAAQWFGASASSIFGATLIEHRKRVLPMGLLIGWGMRAGVLGLALGGFFELADAGAAQQLGQLGVLERKVQRPAQGLVDAEGTRAAGVVLRKQQQRRMQRLLREPGAEGGGLDPLQG